MRLTRVEEVGELQSALLLREQVVRVSVASVDGFDGSWESETDVHQYRALTDPGPPLRLFAEPLTNGVCSGVRNRCASTSGERTLDQASGLTLASSIRARPLATTAVDATISAVPTVPLGFPFKLDDQELDEAISEMLEPGNWPGFDNFANLLPELKLALVASGLRERQQRDQAASDVRALRVAYATLAISVIAIVVAVVTSLSV
jgi:hypothetical protein